MPKTRYFSMLLVALLVACGQLPQAPEPQQSKDPLETEASSEEVVTKPRAEILERLKTIHSKVRKLDIALNSNTVLCSTAGYGMPFLKVIIPQLAGLTLLDHRNPNAGGPSIAAGSCMDGGPMPGDLIDPNKPTENVAVELKVKRRTVVDHEKKTCDVALVEDIRAEIRGITFTHVLEHELGVRQYEDCL
jgi:hypothetical protein